MDISDLSVTGNLCRCTGYRPILQGFQSFTTSAGCPMGERCCKNGGGACGDPQQEVGDATMYDSSQEPIFPPELKASRDVELSPMITLSLDR